MPSRIAITFLPLLLLALLTGCQMPVEHRTQATAGINFDKYRTYIWHPQGTTFVGVPVQRAQLAQAAIRSTVDQSLTKKGLKPATFETPDFFIATTVGAVNVSAVKKWGQGQGGYTAGQTEVPLEEQEIREGTIVLDFIDNATGTLIWRGTAHGVIDPTADPRPRVEAAVRSMMAGYPPR